MDTVTQALLGAVVGKAFFSGKLGKRAMVWGAVGGALPDLDMLAIQFAGPWGEVLYHRGPTHALWFAPLAGTVLGVGIWRFYRRGQGMQPTPRPGPGAPAALPSWIGLFVLALLTHPLLDLFTSYGTQLLTPFSRERYALHAVGIVDPFYSLILVAALFFGDRETRRGQSRTGRRAAIIALVLSTAYLFYGLTLNARAEHQAREHLLREGIQDAAVRCYPTVLQPYLRRVVARYGDTVRVGTITLLNAGSPVWEEFTVPDHPMIDAVLRTPEGQRFEWFAMGELYPHVIPLPEGVYVEIDDLRYGFHEPADQGLWGIRAVFDRAGQLQGNVERFSRPFPDPGETFRRLWRGTFGIEGVQASEPAAAPIVRPEPVT